MPIKRTGFPTLFVPQLNVYAKALILAEFNWMARFFTMGHRFNSQNTYVDVYYREVVKEQKMEEVDFDLFIKKYPEIANKGFSNVLKYLSKELTDSRQRSYCREIFNRMALHISNAINDRYITIMLDKFIDEEVDVILCDTYKAQNLKTAKQINVNIAGSLPSLISENEKYEIEHLIITGYLNGTDIKFLREISYGHDKSFNYSFSQGKLSYLNLENASIVEGGEPYLTTKTEYRGVVEKKVYYTKRNIISEHMFTNTILQNMILPENTILIEDEAFACCLQLQHITIPKGVKSIGNAAFSNCDLISISIPESVTSFGQFAFQSCNQLKNIIIPSTVSFIGRGAFEMCQSLEEIHCKNTMPPTFEKNGNNYLFDEDYSISNIEKNCILYVPNGSARLYNASEAWKNFKNIIEQ
ncbi:MAG: leucine-rich repeat domain-containing protein [Tannerella sp.]|jgi:hypothetical protein|nr:leucine-rich repeat domain-containing protein [Tannerella sp.]